MSTANQKHKTITEQRIKSSKLLLFICSLVALISDIVVLVVLLINATEPLFWICPVVIAALDAIFLIKIIFSNYRFSYAFSGMLLHIGLLVATCVCAWLFTGYLEERIVFETIALYAMPVLHLLQCIAVLVTALYASKKGKLFRRILTAALMLLFAVGAGVYGKMLFTDGFFGQGFSQENRTVVYALDKENQCYIVKGVLDGGGKNVVIPAEFNGLPVKALDCALFSIPDIDTVQLNCNVDLRFENVEALTDAKEDITILAASENNKMDSFRHTLYALVAENPNALLLANRIYPSDLESNEIYVTFRYSLDTLQFIEDEIIPTWIGKKEESFDFKKHASEISYIKHSDVTDNEDLYFCYQQQDGNIFRDVVNGEGQSIDASKPENSIEATIEFDKIYRVSIAEDNDDKYAIDTQYRFLETDDGTFSYKLATAENVAGVLNALPMRNGFSFAWYVGQDKHPLQDLNAELVTLDAQNKDCLELYPTWALNQPTITTLTADGVTEGHSAVYGNDVELHSVASAPDSSISLRYEWSRSAVVANTSTYTLENLHPEDAGEYTLTVTAYSDEVTSLTAAVSQKINVGFEKRELGFDWILPSETVYSGTDKSIGANPLNAINDDKINIQLSRYSVKNVGEYEISIALTGDTDRKYYVKALDLSRTVKITPCTVDVLWGDITSFVYNGLPQKPTATAMGVGEDGEIDIDVTGEALKVGENYEAIAATTNANYELAKNRLEFNITRRPISIASWGTDSFVYNGSEQGVTVGEISNVVAGEEGILQDEFIYTGKAVNVGTTYTATVSLQTNSNYMLTGETSKSFTITPKPLTVSISNKTVIYQGTPVTDFSFTPSGLVGSDTIDEVLSLAYKGDALTAINVNKDGYKIDADIIEAVKYGNYDVTLTPGTLRIQQRELTIKVINAEKTYDGTVYPKEKFDYTPEGLADTDSFREVCVVEFTGDALTGINAGKYDITIGIDNREKYGNYRLITIKGSLTINPAPLEVTAVGGTKIYDGTPANKSEFSILVEGLIPGETVKSLGNPTYSGDAISNKNVGPHALKVSFEDNAVTANYDISYTDGVYEITRRDLIVTAVGGSKVYNGDPGGSGIFDFDVEGLVGSDTKAMLGTPDYGDEAENAKNADTYRLTVSLPKNTTTDNYNIKYNEGYFIIEPKPITVSVNNSTKTYDGKLGGNFDFSVNGLVEGENKSVLGAPDYYGDAETAINVGSYTIYVALPGNGNYSIESYKEGTLQIKKKNIVITPSNAEREYDGTVSGVFEFKVEGLVDGDTKAILGTPAYGGTAVTARNAGPYTLTVTFPYYVALENQNYNLICNTGSFVITKKVLEVIVGSDTKVYDGTKWNESFFSFDNVIGLVGGDTVESLGSFEYSGAATYNKNVGKHKLSVRFDDNAVTDNYDISYTDGVYEITKKDLIVTAPNVSKVYNGIPGGYGIFDFDVDGLVGSDTKAKLGTPDYGDEAETAKNVGTYSLTVTLPDNTVTDNYNIISHLGSFTITPKTITVSAINATKTYDGKLGGNFDFRVSDLAVGDTKSVLGAPTYGIEAMTAVNVGTYKLSVELPGNDNYYIESYSEATFTIIPKTVIVTPSNAEREYDGNKGGVFKFEVEGLVDGDTKAILGTPTYGGTAETARNAGSYELTVTFPYYEDVENQNYNLICHTGSFVITKKELVISAVATDRVYDGTKKGGEFSFVMSEPLAFGDTVAEFGELQYWGDAVDAIEAGSYTLNVRFINPDTEISANYEITYVPDDFVISPAVEPEPDPTITPEA